VAQGIGPEFKPQYCKKKKIASNVDKFNLKSKVVQESTFRLFYLPTAFSYCASKVYPMLI
jgi:hypothetical protein